MLVNRKGREDTQKNKNKISFNKFHGTVGHAEKVFPSGPTVQRFFFFSINIPATAHGELSRRA